MQPSDGKQIYCLFLHLFIFTESPSQDNDWPESKWDNFHIYRTEILWAFLFTRIGSWQFSPSCDKIKLSKDSACKQTMKRTIATFPPAFCRAFCSELDNNARHPATADPASCYDAGVTIWRWMCWTLPLTFWRRCSNLSHPTIATLGHTFI